MRYKRDDAFRYEFEKPLESRFRIDRVDGEEVSTSEGEAFIIDISPTGLKLNSELDIPQTDKQDIYLSLTFQLNDAFFELSGKIAWKKESIGFVYGIDLTVTDTEKEKLIEQIKFHATGV